MKKPIPENPDVPLDDDPEVPDPPGPAITERETSVLPTPALTRALELLTEELRRRENPGHKVKSKEPDTFDVLILRSLTTSFSYATSISELTPPLTLTTMPKSRLLCPISEAWPWNILNQPY